MADTSNDAALAAELQAQADVETPLIAQPAPPVVIADLSKASWWVRLCEYVFGW